VTPATHTRYELREACGIMAGTTAISPAETQPCSSPTVASAVSSGIRSIFSALVPCSSQGEFRRLLDALHRNFRLDALHPMTSAQVSDLKAAVIIQVFRHNSQEEIAVACHQVALDHLRHSPDHFGEAIYGLFILRSQPDAGEQGQADADLGRV
jgi:hypothetical protein